MSEYRAILVSEEAITEIANIDAAWADETVAALDAAGDRPRIRWCAEHGEPAVGVGRSCPSGLIERNSPGEGFGVYRCRVVDAIVCVLEEES